MAALHVGGEVLHVERERLPHARHARLGSGKTRKRGRGNDDKTRATLMKQLTRRSQTAGEPLVMFLLYPTLLYATLRYATLRYATLLYSTGKSRAGGRRKCYSSIVFQELLIVYSLIVSKYSYSYSNIIVL